MFGNGCIGDRLELLYIGISKRNVTLIARQFVWPECQTSIRLHSTCWACTHELSIRLCNCPWLFLLFFASFSHVLFSPLYLKILCLRTSITTSVFACSITQLPYSSNLDFCTGYCSAVTTLLSNIEYNAVFVKHKEPAHQAQPQRRRASP